MTDSVNDAMREMGKQADPLREMLRRMLAEFGDQHYHTCPRDNDSGPCDCFAGHLVKDALALLAAQQDGARPHKLMTREEYDAEVLMGRHSVCHNYDSAGNTGIWYHGVPEQGRAP